jgi:hypothetical protein
MFPGDIVQVKFLNSSYEDNDNYTNWAGKTGIVIHNPNPTEIPLKDNEWLVSFLGDSGKEEIAVFTRDELFLIKSPAADSWDKEQSGGFFANLRRKLHM